MFIFSFVVLGCWLFKNIDDAKQKHALALLLANRLIQKEDWSRYINFPSTYSGASSIRTLSSPRAPDPLIQATKLGILELVMGILKKYPEAADSFDDNGRNILHISVGQKHRFLYDYLMCSVVYKDRMLADVDFQGNTVIHMATCSEKRPPRSPGVTDELIVNVHGGQGNTDFHVGGKQGSVGVVNQMSWDVLWFKVPNLSLLLVLQSQASYKFVTALGFRITSFVYLLEANFGTYDGFVLP